MWDQLGKNIGLDEDFGEGDVSLGPLHGFSKLKVVDVEQKCFTGRYHFKPGRDREEEQEENLADPPLRHVSESLLPCLETLTIRGSSDFHPELLEKLLTSLAREFYGWEIFMWR